MNRLASGTIALAVGALALGAASARAQQAPAPAQQDNRPTIAILDFDVGAAIGVAGLGTSTRCAGASRRMTIQELAANPAVRVVERAQIQQILQEQNLGHEGRVDQAHCAPDRQAASTRTTWSPARCSRPRQPAARQPGCSTSRRAQILKTDERPREAGQHVRPGPPPRAAT